MYLADVNIYEYLDEVRNGPQYIIPMVLNKRGRGLLSINPTKVRNNNVCFDVTCQNMFL